MADSSGEDDREVSCLCLIFQIGNLTQTKKTTGIPDSGANGFFFSLTATQVSALVRRGPDGRRGVPEAQP
jgi:hypothetical protein